MAARTAINLANTVYVRRRVSHMAELAGSAVAVRQINVSLSQYSHMRSVGSLAQKFVPRQATGRRTLVSKAATDQAPTNTASLKSMIKPFYLKCHPDVQTSDVAKQVNMKALKSINGFVSAAEATIMTKDVASTGGRLVEWPSDGADITSVEFIVGLEQRVKKEIHVTYSRRQVGLKTPPRDLRDRILSAVGDEKRLAVRRLEEFVRHELARLLKVAGLPVPKWGTLDDEQDENREEDWLEQAWAQEFGWGDKPDGSDGGAGSFGASRRFDTPRRPKAKFETSRDRFLRSVNWKRFREVYDKAVKDMYADVATQGLIGGNKVRRQQFISNIMSRVRIDKDANLSVVDQMVTIRRLSLLLDENFEELELEDMGRMWENLTIVLAGYRDYNTSSSSLYRRKRKFQETGFRFAYGENDALTVHIPVDFRNDEFLRELQQNLRDFYNLMEDDEMEELFPGYRRMYSSD